MINIQLRRCEVSRRFYCGYSLGRSKFCADFIAMILHGDRRFAEIIVNPSRWESRIPACPSRKRSQRPYSAAHRPPGGPWRVPRVSRTAGVKVGTSKFLVNATPLAHSSGAPGPQTTPSRALGGWYSTAVNGGTSLHPHAASSATASK